MLAFALKVILGDCAGLKAPTQIKDNAAAIAVQPIIFFLEMFTISFSSLITSYILLKLPLAVKDTESPVKKGKK